MFRALDGLSPHTTKSQVWEGILMFLVLLICIFCLWLVAKPVHAEPAPFFRPTVQVKLARVLTLADMKQPPLTALAFTQCNLLIAAYFTLQNGDLAKIDIKHHGEVDYSKALTWGDTALHGAERAEAPCVISPGQEIGT